MLIPMLSVSLSLSPVRRQPSLFKQWLSVFAKCQAICRPLDIFSLPAYSRCHCYWNM